MKEKILALLLAKFAGVRKDGLAQMASVLSLQAADEAEATAIVEKLTTEKVDVFVKDWRKEVDREVSEGVRTNEENLRKKFDFTEKQQQQQQQQQQPGGDEVPAWAKALVDSNKALQEKLLALESGKTVEARLSQLQEKFKALPQGNALAQSFIAQKQKDFKRMNFESDEAFAEYLTDLETDVTTMNQQISDAGLSNHTKPIFGTGKGSEDDLFQQSMKAINAEESK